MLSQQLFACSIVFVLGCRGGAPLAPHAEAPSGAELWSEHCQRCHRMRDSSELDRDAWGVVMLHMRVRANLTAAETHEILTFMTSGQ